MVTPITGKPVSMGTYGYSAGHVVNFRMLGCRMDKINDRSRWGVIGSNFMKNILLEDCALSRMDVHQGVSGSYVIRRCTLGYAGLNAVIALVVALGTRRMRKHLAAAEAGH